MYMYLCVHRYVRICTKILHELCVCIQAEPCVNKAVQLLNELAQSLSSQSEQEIGRGREGEDGGEGEIGRGRRKKEVKGRWGEGGKEIGKVLEKFPLPVAVNLDTERGRVHRC